MILEFLSPIRRADNPQYEKTLLESRTDVVKCAAFVRTLMPAPFEARETQWLSPADGAESIVSVFEIRGTGWIGRCL